MESLYDTRGVADPGKRSSGATTSADEQLYRRAMAEIGDGQPRGLIRTW